MLKDKLRTGRKWSLDLGGILAGMAVSMSGNFHYIIYGIILRLLKIKNRLLVSKLYPLYRF
jgi:hypothetical protein